jgi:transposase
MDNATYHKSAAACAAISLFDDRVHVFWLPAYCPLLNPIERFWLHLKRLACANKLYSSLPDLISRAQHALSQQNHLSNPYHFIFEKSFD